jgi:hypothetical protein
MNDLHDEIPSFDELAADPDIAPLLDFTPVPRSHAKANGWSPDMQRMFIAWLAYYGSPTNACDELGKARSGIDKVFKSPGAEEFRASWDGAIALAEKRRIAALAGRPGGAGALRPPTLSRAKPDAINGMGPQPGQVLNEHGEWEDEESYRRRGEEAIDSIGMKLVRCRRAFLAEISGSAGKRAAFEILTELPVDWELAETLQPQPFEPWTRTNQRQPDMVLTAESGWSFGEIGYGPDRKAEMRAVIDEYRAERGLEPIDWDDQQPECRGHSGPDHLERSGGVSDD